MLLLDMNDFLFFVLANGDIRTLTLDADALQAVVNLWLPSFAKFVHEDITEVPFSGLYKPENDEVLTVTMALPANFSNIPDNTVIFNEVAIPGDDTKTIGLYHDGNYYFQNFLNRFILKPNNLPLIWSNDTYKKFDNQKAFTIEETVTAIYHDGKLYFRSYASAKQIFNLSPFFTEATNTDIDNVFGTPLFNGTDCEWMKANSDSVMRKQIKSIENSGILNKLNITTKVFKSWAKKAGVPENVYSTGSLVFPKNKKVCKLLLSFLNDDIFEGHFTKSIFMSNSKRKP